MNKNIFAVISLVLLVASCGNLKKQTTDESASLQPVGPVFCADSAYLYCQAQCDFGPRTMNSKAHDDCEKWIISKFESFGMQVTPQKAVLKGYDGTSLNSTNIIASYRPDLTDRVLLCAHWDSRPWADNDPDEANWKTPVMAANDGASGVAVMLEIARLLSKDTLQLGVDFICFDAEDWGVPQWNEDNFDSDSWALGAQYWSTNLHKKGYRARFGILLDMVGGQGAQFYKEAMSVQYANHIVEKVWRAAQVVGYGSMFPSQQGTGVTDDHISVNTKAKIPTIDIIPYYPNCEQSSFGPTWHTVNDDMEHIDKNTLQAVGQTLIQVLFSEK
ncbi:MAG: M28 family peptidase [Prevotella sp.]|jgi:Zn-dependent M28 family amino/carboxypeptidase|uniref:Peptidase family M28 n=1 Tax=Xylanibacter ruminicola TaxID=839 RepID=A0A1M7N9B5_XYLRU|nr:M28 family peptidase [Xylanibacter ruminicola]MBQ6054124.1 M28 family peptidase [Prevotella sp.]MBQ6917460.1 M28 family peptidase [Prevotella sp.]MBR0388776.1 M28 family peptidase [Prevotella sp.]MDO4984301.1 M28 family peptidase [Prevotella sp.]SFB69879.1 Peptidase family M28 [Xylanibacter ruminicola]